jgi:hypothetical protein
MSSSVSGRTFTGRIFVSTIAFMSTPTSKNSRHPRTRRAALWCVRCRWAIVPARGSPPAPP